MLNKIISDGKIPMWKENKMPLWRFHCLDKIKRIDSFLENSAVTSGAVFVKR